MPPRKRQPVSPSVFDAVRHDASLTPKSEIAVAMRPEWVWAAQILTRLGQERATAGFARRYLSAIASVTLRRPESEHAQQADVPFEDLLAALSAPRSRRAMTRVAQAAARLIDEADANACTSVAEALAMAALRLCEEARPTAYAHLLWRAARARRMAGDLMTAQKYSSRVLSIGRRHKDHLLIARGTLGLAILARERGNVDAVIRLFKEVHEHAQLSKSREMQILAHQGMQIATGVIGDHANELRHAWLAYSLSIGDAVHEYEALHNVAWYACRAGIANEALPALRAVLAQIPLKLLLKFHYLGTTATAAAQCERRDVVDEVRAELERFRDSEAHPYEHGLALIYVGEALDWLGDRTLGRQYRGRARAIAKRFGLHDLLQLLRSPQSRASVTYPIDSETAAEVDEVSRVLRTITGGVLAEGSVSAEHGGMDARNKA